jgi:hypothetical protein
VNRATLIKALGFSLGVLGLSFGVGREIHVAVGGGRGPLMMSGLGQSEAAWNLPGEEIADGRHDFYFRRIEAAQSTVSIPLLARGPVSVALRMDSTVRTRVDLLGEGAVLGSTFVTVGPWKETLLGGEVATNQAAFDLRFVDAPLVRRSDRENFSRSVDEVVVRTEAGFVLPWRSRIAGALLVLLLVSLVGVSSSISASLLAALIGPATLAFLSWHEPVALALGLPRLTGFAFLAAALTWALCSFLKIIGTNRAALTAMGAAMVLGCGFLSFLPDHSPADLDIHIWRTLDLADVPMSYDAWLRYGSHYPTPSQIRGSATEALGEGPAIPYSPLPYVLFYAAHAAGLDLHWSMNAIEAASLALLLPLVFAFARAASSDFGGLLAAGLMAMDLATIHHLGRAHSPAVVGGALGIAGLLAMGLALPRIQEPGRFKAPALCLGVGALGYSSTPLFYALFGIALLALLGVQRDLRRLAAPVAFALGLGGAIALVLFYGHYLPGLSGGGGAPLLADPFPGRTYFIFHNESRQSLRLWRLGLYVPFLAALPAIILIVARCAFEVRAFLVAWLSAWAGVALLKEPWALPRLLRWAKEDFYVAPALALVIAIAIARIESRPLRLVLAALGLLTAAFLRARDYGFHADTLRFLR